jgi:protein-L-isoaspartate(D-aspartate) O-methyltransferase
LIENRLKKSKFYQKHKYRIMQANDILSLFSGICLIFFLIGDSSKNDLKNHYMINEIKMNALITGFRTGVYKIDDQVLKTMASVPRHHFFEWKHHNKAYHNVALPLDGSAYIIPEPFVTAVMLDSLSLKSSDKVLEIGFGTGYETAVLSKMAGQVYSVRPLEVLREKLNSFTPVEKRGFENVFTTKANNLNHWVTHGPFDAILIKQSMPAVPKILLENLKQGGRLVIPVQEDPSFQYLTIYTKTENNKFKIDQTLLLNIPPLLQGKEI